MKKIVIIGGMAAGCKAASRLGRIMPRAEITIIEKRPFLSYGACGLPLYASGEVDGFLDLAKTPYGAVRDAEFFKNVKGVTALIETIAEIIEPIEKFVKVRNLITGNLLNLKYDSLIIATGAKPVIPDIPMPETDRISTFHNPINAKKFREMAQKGIIGSAVIIGGGYIGCELAEALVSMWGIETTIIEMDNRLLPRSYDKEMSRIIENLLKNNDISVRLNEKISQIGNENDALTVMISNGEILETDYVFLCTGIKPDHAFADAIGLKTGKSGGILVDSRMRTNIEGIYAAGDCIETVNFVTGENCFAPLGSLANRQGRVAADTIAGIESHFGGTALTASMKIFGLITATSGISENEAAKWNINYSAICANWHDRPDYHPDNKDLFAKMIYERGSLRLLGLQLAGRGEVTRYIDVFSKLLSRHATAYNLEELEHAYNPPHSSPVSPLNFLGELAVNLENSGIKCLSPLDLEKFSGVFIDVRENAETIDSPLRLDSIIIPLDHLRESMDQFDKNCEYLFICQRGSRSYEAAKLFQNAGFEKVAFIGGGVQFIEADPGSEDE